MELTPYYQKDMECLTLQKKVQNYKGPLQIYKSFIT